MVARPADPLYNDEIKQLTHIGVRFNSILLNTRVSTIVLCIACNVENETSLKSRKTINYYKYCSKLN